MLNPSEKSSGLFVEQAAESGFGAVPSIPDEVLEQALDNFLDKTGPAGVLVADVPEDALRNPPVPSPLQLVQEQAQENLTPNPSTEEIDPLHPSEKVWQALEQVAQEEAKDKLHQSQLHRLEPPEELPDISNL